jgi:hypothetical protein
VNADSISPFLIEIIVNIDSDLENGFLIIDSSNEQVVTALEYIIVGGTITDATIVTSALNTASF